MKRKRFDVVANVDVTWTEIAPDLSIWVATDPDAVLEELDEETFVRTDERMPYFATLWPSSLAIVPRILCGEDLSGVRVLDLGCGVGATGLAAARKGARVTFFDWDPRAVEIALASAERLGIDSLCDGLAADWRDTTLEGPFDRIYGADVLYEARNLEPVAALVARVLADDGVAELGDPGRGAARPFDGIAKTAGLSLEIVPLPHPDGSARVIDLHLLRRI